MDDAIFSQLMTWVTDQATERAHMVDGNESEKWQGTQRWGG